MIVETSTFGGEEVLPDRKFTGIERPREAEDALGWSDDLERQHHEAKAFAARTTLVISLGLVASRKTVAGASSARWAFAPVNHA
jgi:hypothetical protein